MWLARVKDYGLTLSEILIVLGLLALLAAFAIPKVINASSNVDRVAVAKKATQLLAAAITDMELNGTVAGSATDSGDLSNWLDYVVADTGVTIDKAPAHTTLAATRFACGATTCVVPTQLYRLPSGAWLAADSTLTFGTAGGNNRAIPFVLDPDGSSDGSVDSVELWLYIDGTVRTAETLLSSTQNSAGTFNAVAGADPDWWG